LARGPFVPVGAAVVAIVCALVSVIALLALLKRLFDVVTVRNAALVERYVEVASRVSAMLDSENLHAQSESFRLVE
jgi:hypothetical protein